MHNKVIVVGGFHEIIELCEELDLNIIGIIDNDITGSYLGYSILGTDAEAVELYKQHGDVPLILTPDKPAIRKKLYDHYSTIGFGFQTVISKSARISKSAIIGNGVVIQAGANVSAVAKIDNFVKINVNANIMHDTVIGSFTTIAPNAVLLGRINVAEMCYIGSNATILPNLYIRNSTTIGAGAVVTKDTKNASVMVGVPAKAMNK